MYLSYESYYGNDERRKDRIEQFVEETLLYTEDRDKIRLEDQPEVVCEAMGRLMEVLIKKNILDLSDVKYICRLHWGPKADTLQIEKEE